MPGFRLHLASTQEVAGETHYHCRLLAKRDDRWCVVGVFALHQEEWERLLLICEVVGIEIEEKPPVSPEGPQGQAL